jgi:hypothetical protein
MGLNPFRRYKSETCAKTNGSNHKNSSSESENLSSTPNNRAPGATSITVTATSINLLWYQKHLRHSKEAPPVSRQGFFHSFSLQIRT